MEENDKKKLPDFLEVKSGDTVYRVTSFFADKGDFRTLWEELIIDRATRFYNCKTA